MALFKIYKGKKFPTTGQITKATEGFAYFTSDDGKFYIDIEGDGTTNAEIGVNRIPLNAYKADQLSTDVNITVGNTIQAFNGTSDIAFPHPLKKFRVSGTAIGWYKIFTYTFTAAGTLNITAYLYDSYSTYGGTFRLYFNRSSSNTYSATLRWLSRGGFAVESLGYIITDSTINIYAKKTASSSAGYLDVVILNETNRVGTQYTTLDSNWLNENVIAEEPAGLIYAIGNYASLLTAYTLDDTTINNTAGNFAFKGSSPEGGTFSGCDWAGIQIDSSNDKFQITTGNSGAATAQGATLLMRSNDSGGSNSTNWTDWKRILHHQNVTWEDWGVGTTEGPTAKLKLAGITIESAAIPSASITASGIITTGNQEFQGLKTFGYLGLTNKNASGTVTQYMDIQFRHNTSNSILGEIYYNLGSTTNVTKSQIIFKEGSPNTTADTEITGKYEYYQLPAATPGLTDNNTYQILTTKNTVTIAQGGTGATTAYEAITNLGNFYFAGIGSNNNLVANDDLDDKRTIGTFISANSTISVDILNTPTTGSGYKLLVGRTYQANRSFQFAMAANSGLYYRDTSANSVTSAWNSWHQIAFTDSDITGNAATATAFSSNRTITLTGAITGSGSSNGTSGWSIETTIPNNSITNNKLEKSTIGIAGTNVALGSSISKTTLLSNLGLTNAAHYIGKATKDLTDGGTENPTISGYDFVNDRKSGDIVLGKDGDKEYIWGLNGWELLGPVDTIQTSTATGTENRMAYYSAANMISASSHYTDNTHISIADSTLHSDYTLYVNGAIGVEGNIIPITNNSYNLGTTNTLRWKSGFFTTSLRVGAINTTASDVNKTKNVYIGPDGFYTNGYDSADTGFFVRGEGTLYARLFINKIGSTETPGIATLQLGNSTDSSKAKNSNGTLQLYSNTTKYTSIKSSLEIAANHLNYLPIYGSTSSNTYYGRLVGIYKGTTSGSTGFNDVGSTSQPVYVTANGVVKPITGALDNDITGNAATATKLASTGTTAQFWRGDNEWSNELLGGLLKITNNSNTVTIGSANTSYTHFSNSADIPFYFNKSLWVDGDLYPYGTSNTRSLGSSSKRWKALFIGTDNSYGTQYIPIYWNAGVPTQITTNSVLTNLASTTAASTYAASPRPGVTGTLGTANGGTGNTSYTSSRLVYTNTATKFATGTIESDGNNIILGDGDYSLSRTAQSGNWNQGVSKALIKITSATGAYPLFAMKSHSGHWLMTQYESSNFYDHLMFGFLSDVDVYGVTNAKNHYDYKVRLIPTIYETNTETVTDRAFVTANYASNSAQTGNTNQPIYIDNQGVATAVSLKPTLNNLLSSLTEGTADALVDAGYIISSNNNGDTSDWYLRSNVTIWNYIKGKYSSTDTTLDTGPIHIRSATANENALVFDRASGEYQYIQSKNPDNNISIVFAASNSDANTTYRFTKDAFYPKANNSKDLGLSGNKWANVYATNFNGALKGNADTATKVNKTLTITLNNSAKTFNGSADTSVSFYAPTAGGTANTQALVGNGATTAPKWVNISPSITITAGTASATPKVNVTVLGQSGTAQAITTATTGVYGATKLTDAYTSTDATLAATGKSILAAIQTLDVAAVGVAAATGNRYISQISETDGKISATLATATIGTTTRPIWIDAGTIKPGSYELKATVNASENVNRAAYYSAKTIIKDADSIYMDASHIGVNGTNTTYQFYVNGITKLNGHTYVGAKAAYNDTNAGWYIGTDGTIWGTHASSGAKISLYGNNQTNWIRINPTTNTSNLTLGAVEDRFTMPKLNVQSSATTNFTNNSPAFAVGDLTAKNIAIGGDAIQGRNASASSPLYLNYFGNSVYIGRYTASTTLASQQGRLLIGSVSTTAEDYSARIDLIVSDTTTGKSASLYPAYIAAYQDHASTPYGHNLVIQSGGNLIIGSGESGGALYTAAIKNNTGEKLYLISDTDSYLYANGSTSANRIGIQIDTSGHLLPIKAEAANSNAQNIGSSTNRWASIYATTFYGTLSGNATTSSTLLGGRAHSDGTKRNWIKIATWSGSCAGANIDTSVTFSVSDGYPNPSTTPHHNGLLYINFRGNNNSTTTTRAFCDWIVGYNITPANWVLTYTITSAYAITLNLYVNSTNTWQAWNITKINEHSWGTTQNKWVLLNGTTGVANLPSGETQVVSSLKTISNNATSATKVNKTLTIKLNNSNTTFNGSADASVTFYAPAAGGTANTQALVGNGATTAPKWVNIAPSISITAGTSSATPKVNVTVLGQSGTAQSITTATTGVYGATKLTDAYTSTDATLAATGKSILAAIQTLDVSAVGVAAATGNRYISQISETDGKISAILATATIGTTTKPIWIDGGTIKACNAYPAAANTTTAVAAADSNTQGTATTWARSDHNHHLPTSGVTAGSYGPSANATPGYGVTFNVPYITVDKYGRVTAASTKTVKIPASDNTNTDTKVNYKLDTTTTKAYVMACTSAPTATATARESVGSTSVYINCSTKVLMGAAWNDYAEFRQLKENKMYAITVGPGRVVYENGDDTLSISTERLMRGCNIVSDTYGFSIGESKKAQLPIAVAGRVLAYPYESKEKFKNHIGWPVCSGPNGTVSIMTEEEEMKYPSRIIGIISAVPDYEIWHGGADVIVDGRVWIKVR